MTMVVNRVSLVLSVTKSHQMPFSLGRCLVGAVVIRQVRGYPGRVIVQNGAWGTDLIEHREEGLDHVWSG